MCGHSAPHLPCGRQSTWLLQGRLTRGTPAAQVTIAPFATDGMDVSQALSVSPTSLEINSTVWEQAQTVTVSRGELLCNISSHVSSPAACGMDGLLGASPLPAPPACALLLLAPCPAVPLATAFACSAWR